MSSAGTSVPPARFTERHGPTDHIVHTSRLSTRDDEHLRTRPTTIVTRPLAAFVARHLEVAVREGVVRTASALSVSSLRQIVPMRREARFPRRVSVLAIASFSWSGSPADLQESSGERVLRPRDASRRFGCARNSRDVRAYSVRARPFPRRQLMRAASKSQSRFLLRSPRPPPPPFRTPRAAGTAARLSISSRRVADDWAIGFVETGFFTAAGSARRVFGRHESPSSPAVPLWLCLRFTA